jgi:TolA-binding protein
MREVMRSSVFLVFILILLSGFLALNGYVRSSFTPVGSLNHKVASLEQQARQAEFRQQLAQDQLKDFQAQVATVLPSAVKGKSVEEGYPLRQLASVVSQGDSLNIERASSAFEKAKAEFRDKHFEDTQALLEDLIEHHPESTHIIEAHFLLAESQYQMGESEKAVGTIETMISLFPESELTGFSLLRLGKIFEKQDRLEDAADIYKAVLQNFPQPEIAVQAKNSLKAVAL